MCTLQNRDMNERFELHFQDEIREVKPLKVTTASVEDSESDNLETPAHMLIGTRCHTLKEP